MANTYSQIYLQVVFAVEGRASVITNAHKEELHKFTTGVVTNRGQKLIAINSMPDHVHLLFSPLSTPAGEPFAPAEQTGLTVAPGLQALAGDRLKVVEGNEGKQRGG